MAKRTPAPIDSAGLVSPVWAEILGLTSPDSMSVTDTTVRGLPALERARAMVTNATAAMLVAARVQRPDGTHLVDDERPLVIRRPHPVLTAVEFYRQVVDSLIMHGNYVAPRVDAGTEFEQLVPAPVGGVSVDDSTGLPSYQVGTVPRRLTWREVLHIRHQAPVGAWWGLGVVERHRLVLSEQLYGRAMGESAVRAGGVPSMLVQLDVDNPTEEQVDTAKSSLVSKMGGKREPLVHGRALSITPVGWSPHDAEFVESRRISFAEACWLVGLRPEDIGASAGQSLTYANRTDDALQRITDGYGPWLSLIEAAFSDLLGPGWRVIGSPEVLLRTSTRERLEIRKLAQEIGVETADESRAEEGRDPLPSSEVEEPEAGDDDDDQGDDDNGEEADEL